MSDYKLLVEFEQKLLNFFDKSDRNHVFDLAIQTKSLEDFNKILFNSTLDDFIHDARRIIEFQKENLLYKFVDIIKLKWQNQLLFSNIIIWLDKSSIEFTKNIAYQHLINILVFDKNIGAIRNGHKITVVNREKYVENTYSLSYLLYPNLKPENYDYKPVIIVDFKGDLKASKDIVLINAHLISEIFNEHFTNLEFDFEHIVRNKHIFHLSQIYSDIQFPFEKLTNKDDTNKIDLFINYLYWLRSTHPKLHYYYAIPSQLVNKEGVSGLYLASERKLSMNEIYFNQLLSNILGSSLELSFGRIKARQSERRLTFGNLFHSQKQFLRGIQTVANRVNDEHKELLHYFCDNLGGFLEVADNYSRNGGLMKTETVSISQTIKKLVHIFTDLILTDSEILGRAIKGPVILKDSLLKSNKNKLFNLSGNDLPIQELPLYMPLLLFKEIIVNALENSNSDTPFIKIKQGTEQDYYTVEISNNLPYIQHQIKVSDLIKRQGYQTIEYLCDQLKWKKKIDIKNQQFIIILYIPIH